MADEVWVSGLLSNHKLQLQLGIRKKYFGHLWYPRKLDASHAIPEAVAALRQHKDGHALRREQFPEAIAVDDEEEFATTGDMLSLGGFYAVRQKLADVFARFNLGDGGLIPVPLYKADLETPWPKQYYWLNFGPHKDTFLPEASEHIRYIYMDKKTGVETLKYIGPPNDGLIAVTDNALEGPDLWVEARLWHKIFLSGGLARALIAAEPNVDLKLFRARVVESE